MLMNYAPSETDLSVGVNLDQSQIYSKRKDTEETEGSYRLCLSFVDIIIVVVYMF